MKMSMQMKISIVFYLHHRTISKLQYQKEFFTVIVLKSMYRVFYFHFQLTMLKNWIYTPIKMQNICPIDLMITLKRLVEKKQIAKHTLKVKNSIGLNKIVKRDQQFLVEKIIYSAEFKNPIEINWKKNLKWYRL